MAISNPITFSVATEGATPVQRAFQAWQVTHQKWKDMLDPAANLGLGFPEEDQDKAYFHSLVASGEVVYSPSICLTDVLHKLVAFTFYGQFTLEAVDDEEHEGADIIYGEIFNFLGMDRGIKLCVDRSRLVTP